MVIHISTRSGPTSIGNTFEHSPLVSGSTLDNLIIADVEENSASEIAPDHKEES